MDEFLSENNIPDGLPGPHLGHSTAINHRSNNDSLGYSAGLALGLGHITTKRERSPSPSDCVSPDTINPPSPAESSEFIIRILHHHLTIRNCAISFIHYQSILMIKTQRMHIFLNKEIQYKTNML